MTDRADPFLYFSIGISAFAVVKALTHVIAVEEYKEQVYPSPIETYLPHIPPFEQSFLPYPPTGFIEGARDVPTSYGTIRVYEFGPANAERKVLLIHGISSPSPALASVAEHLASKGCRVMLFDLFGRGWSGGPAGVRYDGRLYATQIFLALASSSVPWTTRIPGSSSGRFSIVGYSLGGCIGSNFTSWYPHLVEDLVLIGTGGLIRDRHFPATSKIMYSGLMPRAILAKLVARRLRTNPNVRTTSLPEPEKTARDAINAETAGGPVSVAGSNRYIDAEAMVNWQLDHNKGFIEAFVSSIQSAPITHSHARWRLIGKRLDEARLASQIVGSKIGEHALQQADEGFGLSPYLVKPTQEELNLRELKRQTLRTGKVLIVLGENDPIILKDELIPDATEVFGAQNVEFKVFEGVGHEVAIVRGAEIAESIWEFWNQRRMSVQVS